MQALPQTDTESDIRALELARKFGAGSVRLLLCLRVLSTIARLGSMASIAVLLGHLIMDGSIDAANAWIAIAATATSVLLSWSAEKTQASAEAHVAESLYDLLCVVLMRTPVASVRSLAAGELIVSLDRNPKAIAGLVITHHVARTMMMLSPLAAAAAIAVVSWEAAAAVVILTPIMIVFFVLVGDVICKRAELQEKTFGRLTDQFADRIRALPTIVSNDAVDPESIKLEHRLETYTRNVFGVLRIAFLNAAIIDFFSSLSIAILAVFLGLGHLKLVNIPGFSHLELWQSLFILMIAPEYFAPLRRYAEQYHVKAQGIAAAATLDRLFASKTSDAPALPQLAQLRELSDIGSPGLVILSGPSGSGKSTLLRHVAGLEPIDGIAMSGIPRSEVSWISVDTFVPNGVLADALTWGTSRNDTGHLLWAASQVGLLDDELLPGGLEAPIVGSGSNLSGGQRIRMAIARALLNNGAVFADEPTAKLDHLTAKMVRDALREIAKHRLVIVATHDPELVSISDRLITLPGHTLQEPVE